MSIATPTAEQAQQACAYMAADVHAPAFFTKLAAHGIEPRTQAEAEQLLQIGAVLQQAENEGQFKQAEDTSGNPFLTYVLQRLTPEGPTQEQVEASIKQAADQVVAQNSVAKIAALIFNHVATGGDVAAEEQPAS
jgi:hypothetical protein